MNTIRIILITISLMILFEGLFLSLFPKQILKSIKKMFKNKENVVKTGLIEIILALIVLFIISL
ncbi:MAG: DUF2065 family protein [Nanoarchaeota archaeon]|nr:DUF2065 family protein [Nanoarchaeota archaeon]